MSKPQQGVGMRDDRGEDGRSAVQDYFQGVKELDVLDNHYHQRIVAYNEQFTV